LFFVAFFVVRFDLYDICHKAGLCSHFRIAIALIIQQQPAFFPPHTHTHSVFSDHDCPRPTLSMLWVSDWACKCRRSGAVSIRGRQCQNHSPSSVKLPVAFTDWEPRHTPGRKPLLLSYLKPVSTGQLRHSRFIRDRRWTGGNCKMLPFNKADHRETHK